MKENEGAHICQAALWVFVVFFFLFFLRVSICCEVCSDVCAAGRRHRWERVMSGPRADTANGIHRGGGRIRDTAEGAEKEKADRRKKKDPRRGVTLPNPQDGGKARSESRGSSDSRKMHSSHLP